MEKFSKFFAMASLIAVSSVGLFADEAYDVMKKSLNIETPNYSQSEILVDMIDKNGNVESTTVIMQYGRDTNDLIATIFDFKSPANVKNTRYLQSEKRGKMGDKYIYLPSLRTTRRVAATERQKSFMGFDYAYDDMSLRDVDADTHEMLDANETRKVGNTTYNCWSIKSTPKKKNDGGYSYRITHVDKNSYIPVFIEFFDKKKAPLKTWACTELRQSTSTIGKKYWIRWDNMMTNLQTGHSTRVHLNKQVLDVEQPDRLFTQNWLNTGK